MRQGERRGQKKWLYDQRLSELCHRQTEKNGVGWCDLHFDFFENRGREAGVVGVFRSRALFLIPLPTVIRSLVGEGDDHKGLAVTELKRFCDFMFFL